MTLATTAGRRFPAGVFAACLAVVVAVLFAGLVIVGIPGWADAEGRIVVAISSAHSGFMDAVALVINAVFGAWGGIIVGVVLVLVAFALTRSPWSAVRTGLLVAVPWAVTHVMKSVVHRPRPDPATLSRHLVPTPASYSFPSGHTAFATALVCAVVLSIALRRARRLSATIGVVVVILVAYSRVYLGVHYPTDVIAAMVVTPAAALATAMILASIPVFRRAPYIAQALPVR